MRELIEWLEDHGYVVVEFGYVTSKSGKISVKYELYRHGARHTFYF